MQDKETLRAKTIQMRLVESSDAEFILKLRLDDRYNQFLSAVSPDVESQRAWISEYKKDEESGVQYYFIIERVDGVPCGTVRIYDLQPESFSWGSWILNEDKTRYAALESAFLVYEFGFGKLGFRKSHFEVMKGNTRVVSFHKKMGAVEIGEDEQNFYFEISDDAVAASKQKLASKLS